jgi:hypothetical protein
MNTSERKDPITQWGQDMLDLSWDIVRKLDSSYRAYKSANKRASAMYWLFICTGSLLAGMLTGVNHWAARAAGILLIVSTVAAMIWNRAAIEREAKLFSEEERDVD